MKKLVQDPKQKLEVLVVKRPLKRQKTRISVYKFFHWKKEGGDFLIFPWKNKKGFYCAFYGLAIKEKIEKLFGIPVDHDGRNHIYKFDFSLRNAGEDVIYGILGQDFEIVNKITKKRFFIINIINYFNF